MAMSQIKILLVGPYPPPYGGMAVQILEWSQRLAQLQGYDCSVLNIGESRNKPMDGCISVVGYKDYLQKLLDFAGRKYVVHLVTTGHSFKSWLSGFVCAIVGLRNGRRTVLVFGSGDAPEYIKKASLISRLVIRTTLLLGGRIVCRNEQTREALIASGGHTSKVSMVPGFLGVPTQYHTELPETIRRFIETRTPLLGATVYVPTSGVLLEEYGIRLLVAAVQELRITFPRLGVVIMGPGPEVRSQIDETNDVDHHLMFAGPLPHDTVLAVMKQLTIFVRPTYTDGDSVSVREALALGVPVVASTTDFRPEGVILFRKGNIRDLIETLVHTVEHSESLALETRELAPRDGATCLLNIYQDLMHGTNDHH
jgi:glycogen synthase